MTREFLKQLRMGRPAQATVVRTYALVRHFSRWVHQKGGIGVRSLLLHFLAGCHWQHVKKGTGAR